MQVQRGKAEDFKLASASRRRGRGQRGARATRHADLRVQLGEKLRLRGQGLDAGLRGELRLTAPQGRLRVDGSVRTVDGTYRAYRQRLNIERGVLTFNGPIENPQLDIEAIRPNLDVRVGVAVTGTVLVPRVRLFSDPDMSDADKLSWLLRGRASEGPGSGDTALLQAAAMALISGDEPSVLDQLFNVIGLDDLSVRQSDDATRRRHRLGRQAAVAQLVRGLRARPERHHRQLAADLPHRAALHHPRAVGRIELDRADLELALELNAASRHGRMPESRPLSP